MSDTDSDSCGGKRIVETLLQRKTCDFRFTDSMPEFGIAQSLRITMKFPKPAFWLAIPVFLVASLALGVNATFGPVAGLAIAALGAAEGDRSLVADAHRHRLEVEPLMRQRHPGAPGKLAVAPAIRSAEFEKGDLSDVPRSIFVLELKDWNRGGFRCQAGLRAA
jgi:hypothetical protein